MRCTPSSGESSVFRAAYVRETRVFLRWPAKGPGSLSRRLLVIVAGSGTSSPRVVHEVPSSCGEAGAATRTVRVLLESGESRESQGETGRDRGLLEVKHKRAREGEAWGRRAYWFPRGVYTVRWESCNRKTCARFLLVRWKSRRKGGLGQPHWVPGSEAARPSVTRERYVAPMDKPDGLWLVTLIHSVESCLRERDGNTRVFLEERERKEDSQCLCVRVGVC